MFCGVRSYNIYRELSRSAQHQHHFHSSAPRRPKSTAATHESKCTGCARITCTTFSPKNLNPSGSGPKYDPLTVFRKTVSTLRFRRYQSKCGQVTMRHPVHTATTMHSSKSASIHGTTASQPKSTCSSKAASVSDVHQLPSDTPK